MYTSHPTAVVMSRTGISSYQEDNTGKMKTEVKLILQKAIVELQKQLYQEKWKQSLPSIQKTMTQISSQQGRNGTVNTQLNMDTSTAPAAEKLQGDQQNIVVKWRHREGIKRSQRDIPFILYKDPEDDLDELDQSKRCMLFLHIYIKCAVHCLRI